MNNMKYKTKKYYKLDGKKWENFIYMKINVHMNLFQVDAFK